MSDRIHLNLGYLWHTTKPLSRAALEELFYELPVLRWRVWHALFGYPRLAPHIAARLDLGEPDAEIPEEVKDALPLVHRKAVRCFLAQVMCQSDPHGSLLEKAVQDMLAFATDPDALPGVRKPQPTDKSHANWRVEIEASWANLNRLRMRIVQVNIRLAVKAAKRYAGESLEFGDMINEAVFGLLIGVDRFDVHRGFAFSTYATWWVRHRLARCRSNDSKTVRIPCHLQATSYEIQKISMKHDGDISQIAKELGKTTKQIERALECMRPCLSMEFPYDDEMTLADRMVDPAAPADEVISDAEIGPYVRRYVDCLNERCRYIIEHRFGMIGPAKTLAQIGEMLGLSRERIRQLEWRALKHLRECIENGPRHQMASRAHERPPPPEMPPNMPTTVDAVRWLVTSNHRDWTADSVAVHLNVDADAVSTILRTLHDQGDLERVEAGIYRAAA